MTILPARHVAPRLGTEAFRPFCWVDGRFRIRGWPDATARALRVPASRAIGRHCWEIIEKRRCGRPDSESCGDCRQPDSRAEGAGAEARIARTHCAVLPFGDPAQGAIVWFPWSRLTAGTAGSAGLEGLVIRGALAERLGSLESILDGIRCVCGADDCELFLVDPSGRDVFLVDCEGFDREAFMEKTRMPLGVGYPGMITLRQQPRFTNHFQQDRLFLRKAVKQQGIRSFLGIPLNHAGRPLGYLGLGWRDGSVPLQWSLRVLEEIKPILRLAIPPRLLPQTGSVVHAAPLVIRCFGPFEVLRDGRLLPASAFARRKALKLLQTLVLRRGAPMHRDELIELLWPGVSARSGANRLHGVLNVLRSALEAGRSAGASRYIVCRDNYYFFDNQAPHCVDLFDFLDLVASARALQRQGGDERALGPLEDAVALYRGDLFTGDTDSESFDLLRVNLRHSYLDAVRALVGLRIHWGQADHAIALLRTALGFEPEALDLHEALVTQLVRAGRISEARQQYDCCRAALRRYVDLELPPRITALEKLLH